MSNSSSSNSVKFDAPEFVKVFKKINGFENKQGYHCLRQLSKFHAENFEESINSARVNIQNLQSLTASKFVDQIQFLTVFVPNNLVDLSDLCYVSPTFLPNIEKVNIFFTEGPYAEIKQMTISQPLIFRGVNFIHDVSKQEDLEPLLRIQCENQDIQIIESEFKDITLLLLNANKISVQNSTFRNVPYFENNYGLSCVNTSNTITIDNSYFQNCYCGLHIENCNNNVSINKIYAQKCREFGCSFREINELNLNGAEIVDCETGIQIQNCDGNVQNCNIDAWWNGIGLYSSTINYRQVIIKKTEGIEGELLAEIGEYVTLFNNIYNYNSVFNEIL